MEQTEPGPADWAITTQSPELRWEELDPPGMHGVDPGDWQLQGQLTSPPGRSELFFLWYRARDVPEDQEPAQLKLPLEVAQALADAVLDEVEQRLNVQSASLDTGETTLPDASAALRRARQVVRVMAQQVEAGELPESLRTVVAAATVETDAE